MLSLKEEFNIMTTSRITHLTIFKCIPSHPKIISTPKTMSRYINAFLYILTYVAS